MGEGVICAACYRIFGEANALAQHRRATHENSAWSAARKPKQRAAPQCPVCGAPAKLSRGKWGIKAECCGLWSWGLKPLVTRETHAARIRAHDAFDRLWKGGAFSRGEGYRRLQVAMGMTSAHCHIAQMTAEQAGLVIEIVRNGALLAMADA
jgi:hypothetical protein